VFELIQYRPATEQVYEVPLLFVPPTINKYYILDISPGRSMVEWLLAQQQQVFTISWRNPDAAQGHFDLDTYAHAVLEARDTVAEITRQSTVNVNAACSGGIIAAGALGHLAAIGQEDQIGALTLMVCALDQARMGTAGAMASRELAATAVAESARRGYIDGRALEGVFAWLRPNDLIWNYVVNNYLLGKAPPAFDILYWNQDSVRLAAGLHRDFVRIALANALTVPGDVEVLGTPIDLGTITRDCYTIAASNDHIVPWENAYRSAQLLGGCKRFALSTSGHIQALVNPPSAESRASYRVVDDPERAALDWVQAADVKRGSWWPDYCQWLTQRAGDMKPAPRTLGSRKHKATSKAPGNYVHAN
jgi:polyhydroxyalkanoate synthase